MEEVEGDEGEEVAEGAEGAEEKLLQQQKAHLHLLKEKETLNSFILNQKHPCKTLLGMLFLFLQKKDALLAIQA